MSWKRKPIGDFEELLTPAEVAHLFRVDAKTVTRWARAGKLSAIKTLGGHRRYRRTEVERLLEGDVGSVTAEDIVQWAVQDMADRAGSAG